MAARNMYPVKKNNWSFRASMIPLTGEDMDPLKALAPSGGSFRQAAPLRELPPELQKRSRVSICKSPPRKAKDKRHVFQRVEDNRHQNALKRYQVHCQNYEESKRVTMKKSDKIEEEMLMENINLYRLRQENILILEKSKSDEDKFSGDNTWEISLREHWTIEADIGDLSSVPQPYDLLGQRVIERIGNPLKENMSLDYFQKSDSRQDTRKSRWGPFEHYMERLEKGIRTMVPHRPNLHGLQPAPDMIKAWKLVHTHLWGASCQTHGFLKPVCLVPLGMGVVRVVDFITLTRGRQLVGNKIRPQTADVQVPKQGDRIKFGKQGKEAPDVGYHQPAAKLSAESVFFSAKAGEIVNHVVTLRNVGTTALFFSWKKRPEDPLVEPSKAWNDANFQVPRQRFTVLESSGRVVPGEVKDFCFSFMSNFAGSFFETWVLWTSPVLLDPPSPVFLKGVATSDDLNRGLRDKLTLELQHREMIHGVEEVMEYLLDTSSDLTCTTLKAKPDYLYTPAAYTLLKKNLGSEPPLYYNPSVDDQFRDLVSALNPILIQEAESRKPAVQESPPPQPPPPPSQKAGKGAPPPPPPEPEPEPEPEPVVTIEWEGSTSHVLSSIEGLTTEGSRNELLNVYSKLIDSAAIPAHPSSTVHLAIYKLFKDVVYPVHDAIEDTLADIAAKAKAEEEARLEARRKKAEEEGLDPDMLEEEEPAPPADEPQIGEDGEEIPPPPPPKLYDCVPVASAVKDVLRQCFSNVEDEIEKLEDAAISVVDSQLRAQKLAGDDEQTLWNIFALERERLFLVLGKDKDFDY